MDDSLPSANADESPAVDAKLARHAHDLAGAIYGTILATSVVAAAGSDTQKLNRTFLIVFVTSLIFWLAHVYSRCVAARMLVPRALRRSEVREIAVSEWPMLQSSGPILLVLLLGVFGWVEKSTASFVAMLVGIGALFVYGLVAAREEEGLPWTRQLLNAVVICSFGVAVLALKVLVH